MSALRIANSSGFYVVGGTMGPDSQSYVVREADEKLYQGLLANEFCHVLTSRQMGKSSLMLRTAARLRKAGIGVAALDLTGIGTNLTPEQWYSGLIVQMGDRLDMETELLDFWWDNVALGPMQRWVSALRKIVLPQRTGRLAIFVDEVDAVASLNFSTDEFFAGIRECYNLRNEDANINRLTFCLLGVVNPADLIRDTRTTPFNVGRRIELTDFQESEALRLAPGLGRSDAENHVLLKRIMYWTNGHPYLTQRLCQAVAENGVGGEIGCIDDSIERMFVSKQAQAYDDNLIFVRERLLRSGADVTALLNLYERVRRRKKVADDDSQPLVSILRLSGITRAEDGVLRVSNRIYERVFNTKWVKQNLPDAELRRQRAAFRRGVLRTTAVATVILAIMAALAIAAFRQRNLAVNQIAVNRKLVYMTSMERAHQEYEKANLSRVDELVQATIPQAGEVDLRGFEWFLLWRYAHLETLRVHEAGHIASVRFLNETDTIAAVEVIHTMVQQRREYLVKYYDRGSGMELRSFKAPAGTNFDMAVFSRNGKYLATDSPDNSVALYDLDSQRQIQKFLGPGKATISIAFSPDRQSLAAAFIDGTFRVWNVISARQKFEGHSQLERPAVAFSPDGTHLAVGISEQVAEILDAETGKSVRALSLPKGSLGLVFFSPEGRTLFATSTDGHIFSWAVRDGKILSFAETQSNEVLSFSFSPDGKTLATGSVDRMLKLWDVASGRELRTIVGHGGWITSVDWSPNGRYLMSGDADGLIKVWDMEVNGIPIWPAQKPNSVFATAFTPQNELLAAGRTYDTHLKVWNLSNGQVIADIGECKTVSSVTFSNDASLIAAALSIGPTSEPHVLVFSVATGKPISKLAVPAVSVYSLDFSPDRTKLISGDPYGNVIISDVFSGREDIRLDSGNMYYRAVFSPDGNRVASADQDGKVRIWDVPSGRIIMTLSGHTGAAKFIKFSSNGRLLATAADDNTVRIWDPASGKELSRAQSDSVQRFVFSPDGRRLVTASQDGAVVLWDLDGMQNVITLRKGGAAPTSLTFSADGLSLAVSDDKGDVRVWQGSQPHS
jgi:WD40 repeat protein